MRSHPYRVLLPSKQHASKSSPAQRGGPACPRRPAGPFLSNCKRDTSARPGCRLWWRWGWNPPLRAPCSRASWRFPLPNSAGSPDCTVPSPFLKPELLPHPSEPLCRASALGLLLQLFSSHPGIVLPKCSCSQEFFLVQGSRLAVLIGAGGVKPRRQWNVAFHPRHRRGKRRAISLRTIAAVARRFPTETGEQSAP